MNDVRIEQMMCMGVFGSHLYGLNTPSSDTDYKGIFIPKEKDLYLGRAPKVISKSTGKQDEKNTSEDQDVDLYSFPNFVRDACKGETYAIDMLHMENVYVDAYIINEGLAGRFWEEMVMNRQKFYSKNMKSLLGYARKQAAKYGIKGSRLNFLETTLNFLKKWPNERSLEVCWEGLPIGEFARKSVLDVGGYEFWWICCEKKFSKTTPIYLVVDSLTKMFEGYGHRAQQAKNNEGVDWKAVSHAFRACYQMRDIYKDGDFTYPLKETDFIKAIKLGNLDFIKEVQPELEAVINEVNALAEKSDLPDEVDVDYWDEFVYDSLKEYYNL